MDLMMLRPGSYGIYPAGNVIFKVNNYKDRII